MNQNELTALPNIGPAVARMLMSIGIERPVDLGGHTAAQIFRLLSEAQGRRQDPCLLDTLVAVVDHANGAPAQPWWNYSRMRSDTRLAARFEMLANTRLE